MLRDIIEMKIKFDNPYNHTITIEKNGETIVEKTREAVCRKCEKVHKGNCKMVEMDMRGRWFFAEPGENVCGACGGNFGGGSVERPGGPGLKEHWGLSKGYKLKCGIIMERRFWENLYGRREDIPKLVRDSLGMKWVTWRWKEVRCCPGCKGSFKGKVPIA